MNYHKSLGKIGENLVKKYLINKGWRFLEANYRCGRYELDLIFRHKNILIFIEVKTRNKLFANQADALITRRQTKNLRQAILKYCVDYHQEPEKTRLDLYIVDIDYQARQGSLIIYENILQ